MESEAFLRIFITILFCITVESTPERFLVVRGEILWHMGELIDRYGLFCWYLLILIINPLSVPHFPLWCVRPSICECVCVSAQFYTLHSLYTSCFFMGFYLTQFADWLWNLIQEIHHGHATPSLWSHVTPVENPGCLMLKDTSRFPLDLLPSSTWNNCWWACVRTVGGLSCCEHSYWDRIMRVVYALHTMHRARE